MAYVIDQPNCSCCHRCKLECPVGAIHFKNSKYYIEPDICTSCGHCSTICHNGCISDPENPKPAAAPHGRIVKECDILVIGAGGAGTVAAAKAADMGKKVILMEKNWEVGGSAAFGHMGRIAYSKWHEAAGAEDPRDKTYARFVKKLGDRTNIKLFRNIIDANVDMANWLIDTGELEKGFELYDDPMRGGLGLKYTYQYYLNDLRTDPSIGPGDSGWYITNALTEFFKSKGGELMVNTRAEILLTDDSGAVIGVLANDPGGQVEVHAKAVIVAAGAFTRNRDLMNKFQPLFYQDEGCEPVHIYTCATCTGDGIVMCEKIGAHIDYYNKRAAMFGPMHHPFSYCMVALSRGASAITVDSTGEEIKQFGMTEIGALANVPGHFGWSILDQQDIDANVEENKNSPVVDSRMAVSNWEKDLADEIADGTTVKADTLEELADKLGFDKAKFMSFIAQHNQDIKDGKGNGMFGPPPGGDNEDGPGGMPGGPFGGDDDDEGMGMPPGGMMMPAPRPLEKGPFYAVKMKMFHENSIGGMTIDENAAVLRPDGSVIPGLYAAGDNTRGFMVPGEVGVQFIEGVVSAMTYAMNSGYLASCSAIDYVD
ncbi:MAG: FAD-dependent oxidoreductase [Ruminococcaceae bacterium]|nr:FAD-dependent oxidoreductase [Oscillospiraceae bacterium]